MERRTFERLHAKLQAKLYYGEATYTGTVANLSENGMFICARMNIPVDSMFPLVLLQNGQSFKMDVRVKRAVRTCVNHKDPEEPGIGVMLLNPPQDYLEFVGKCRPLRQ
jgi:hypothetical protein